MMEVYDESRLKEDRCVSIQLFDALCANFDDQSNALIIRVLEDDQIEERDPYKALTYDNMIDLCCAIKQTNRTYLRECWGLSDATEAERTIRSLT